MKQTEDGIHYYEENDSVELDVYTKTLAEDIGKMRITPNYEGAWDSTKVYNKMSVVVYEENSYIAKVNKIPAGTKPTDKAYYDLYIDNSVGKSNKERIDSLEETTDKMKNTLEIIEEQLTILANSNSGHIYGVKRLYQDAEGNLNSDPSWTRILDSANFVANANKAISGDLKNDFDNVYPYNQILSCNMNSQNQITAWYGDSNFKFDGSNGDVMTRVPRAWYYRARVPDNTGAIWEIKAVADYAVKNFFEVKTFYGARYLTSIIDDQVHSFSGRIPQTSKNITEFRVKTTAKSNKHCLFDWRHFVIDILFTVEYANNNIQNILGNGVSNDWWSNSDKALISETSTNRIVLATAKGNSVRIGQNMHIGKTDVSQTNVMGHRTVTAKEPYSENGIVGVSIYFDGDPVNIEEGNIFASSPTTTGGCNSLGMKSGCIKNDGLSSMIYRGFEDIIGNLLEFRDGIAINNYITLICTDPSKYSSTDFSEYESIDYENLKTSGVYPLTTGCDAREGTVFSLIAMPTKEGGSSTTGTCDYYYCSAGLRVACVGGSFAAGAACGLSYWHVNSAFSLASAHVGARFLINT